MNGAESRHASGHGTESRGRFSSSPVEAATRDAMQTLLGLERVSAREVFTELPHGRVFHLEAGAGPPLVLFQGAGGGAANWYRLLGPLSRSRRVLAPELPGFGLSDAVTARAPLGEHAAEILSAWLDANVPGGAVDIVATSFGGLVALRLAAARPDRVSHAVLLNAAGLGRGVAAPVRAAGLPVVRELLRTPSRWGTALLFRTLLTSDRSRLPPAHQAAIIEYTWRATQRGAGRQLAEALAMFANLRGQREVLSSADLARIRCPVLIVWGAADRFLPARHAARAARAIPTARSVLLGGIGHSPNWEAPAEVLREIDAFLAIP